MLYDYSISSVDLYRLEVSAVTEESISDVVTRLNNELETIQTLQHAIDDNNLRRKSEIATINKRYDVLVDPDLAERDKHIQVSAQLANNYREHLPLTGKTLKLRNGTIQWRKNPISLVFDVAEKAVIVGIRKYRGMRRFTETTIAVKKTLLKGAPKFVALLAQDGLVHYEEVENFVITLPNRKQEIVQTGNPYKVEVPHTE